MEHMKNAYVYANYKLAKIENLKRGRLGFYTLYRQIITQKNHAAITCFLYRGCPRQRYQIWRMYFSFSRNFLLFQARRSSRCLWARDGQIQQKSGQNCGEAWQSFWESAKTRCHSEMFLWRGGTPVSTALRKNRHFCSLDLRTFFLQYVYSVF